MEQKFCAAIQNNLETLKTECNLDTLLPLLLKKNTISNDIIEKYKDKNKRSGFFLDIQKQEQKCFYDLIAALRESNQNSLADLLEVDSGCKRTHPFQLPIHPFQPELSIPDDVEININLSTEPLKVNVKPATEFFDQAAYTIPVYKTSSKYRGKALIINVINYITDMKNRRNGAEVDSKNLKELFTQIGMKVELHEDLKAQEIKDVIKRFVVNEDLKKVDIGVVVIMAHGYDESVIIASDGITIETQWIEEQLNNKNCPNLQMKPKIIIYQFCRGDFPDYGTRGYLQTDSMGKLRPMRTLSDMLIAHATVRGYKAHRDIYLGSWYIQILCQVFMEFACKEHVEDLLLLIDSRLEKLYSEDLTIQTSTYSNHAFKRCYLHPGIYLEDGIKKSFDN